MKIQDVLASALLLAATAPAAGNLLTGDTAGPGLNGTERPAAEFAFTVAAAPRYGAHFSFKLTDATQTGPQAAVFLNGMLQGIVQLWGTSPAATQYKWRKTYSLYLPPNAFKPGSNALSVALVPPMWSDASNEVMKRFWFTWENVRLEPLTAPPREPLHGSLAYLGTTLKQNTGFDINDDTLALVDVALPWIGAAYCGNTMRADFWYDVTHLQPKRRAYLEKLRDYNCTVLADHVAGHFRIDATGALSADGKAAIAKFFADYGDLIHFYELGNEPCMFWGAYADYLATASHIHANRPPHVLLAATGWAYGGGKGEPVNWDADPARRRTIETWCDTLNGHAYGNSYNDTRGGSFFETFKTHGEVEDGWPKEFVVSETGANDWHSEENGPRYPSRHPHASAFDRILRAHLAVVDRTMQHSLIFDDFGLFDKAGNANDFKASLRVRPGPNGDPPRLATFRRLALAYATHGAPLETEILNKDELRGRLVLVRAVDTLAIAPQAGSGATSDKILVSLINFEDRPNKVSVRVKMPKIGEYAVLRIGDGENYAAAHKEMPRRWVALTRSASPPPNDDYLFQTFDDTLAPGEGVQYILSLTEPRQRPAEWSKPLPVKRITYKPPAAPALSAPTGLRAFGLDGRVVVDFIGIDGADLYLVERSENNGAFKPTKGWSGVPKTIDTDVRPGVSYAYRARAKNAGGESPVSAAVPFTPEAGIAPEGWTDIGIGTGAGKGASAAKQDGSLVALTGGGHDIWGPKDGLRFLYKKIRGDVTLVARVLHYDETHPYMKAGLMARLSEDESSPMAFMGQSTGSSLFNWRTERAGECGQHGTHKSAWHKLERRGDKLIGYASPDGTFWTKVAESVLPQDAELLIGLALCSHADRLSTAFFDNVSWQ